MRSVVSIAAFVVTAFLCATATFAEGFSPRRSLRVGAAHVTERVAAGRVASHVEAEVDLSLDWGAGTHIDLGALMEPVRESDSARPGPFDRADVMVETVTVRRVLGRADVRAGKFAQRFGAALDEAPGSYGREFAESYELESGWGVEASAPVSSERWGSHRISAGVWTGDRSFLRRGLFDRADEPGAPGPAGWRIGLDSESIPGLDGFNAHASYVERTGGVRGFALAARHDREIGAFALDALVEFASLRGAHRERYAIASTAIRASVWRASLSHSLRDTGRGREHRVGVELRRDLGDGLHVGAGWQKSGETGSVGTLELRFDWPG